MRNKFLMGVVLSLPLLIASCFEQEEVLFPMYIENSPEWLSGYVPGWHAYSSWNDWPGENHPLATLLSPMEANKKRYDGSFLITYGHFGTNSWNIVFANGTGSSFTLWLGLNAGPSGTMIPQPDPSVFEYTAHIYNHAYGEIPQVTSMGVTDPDMGTPEPRVGASVHFKLHEETEEYFRYQFKLIRDDGSILLETEMTALRTPWYRGNEKPDWLSEKRYLIEMGDYARTPRSPYSIYTSSSPEYVYYISGEITKTNPYTALRQEEIDDTQKRVLYSVYGASPDSNLYYIEAHRNTRETVVFRFMDKEKGILEEGTGWISQQEDLETW